ncbi:hypothetical protein FEM48_Zijuj12G0164500 [Ziziphus jujuba var. spinosa]|uniref:C2 domain-containing protein n=1 Tax=Ziziphus jujuba var. spinosa TaxID=714518 RepID=A0A978UEE3_ZIZJJ|nr:hypothetical protein FEM48_Zijuj12G0164500 [Ziziphus jujuba var. spinosa]
MLKGKDEKACWNEKFTFELPFSDWKNLTHLKFRIMDTELFTDGGFVGDSIIYLGGIVREGYERGTIEIKPAPYNVVLEDDTYKGQIKVGIKFTTNLSIQKDMHIIDTMEEIAKENKPRKSMCSSIINLWRFLRSRSLVLCKRKDYRKQKNN